MNASIQVFVYGSLLKTMRQGGQDKPIRMELESALPLPAVLSRLSIPAGRVQLAMVNHRAVAKDVWIQPGDRVSLFPPEYPIFADWCDLRA